MEYITDLKPYFVRVLFVMYDRASIRRTGSRYKPRGTMALDLFGLESTRTSETLA